MGSSLFCSECTKKTCLVNGTPCKRVELYLNSKKIFSRKWIRPHSTLDEDGNPQSPKPIEIPFSSLPPKLLRDFGLDAFDTLTGTN